jgi:hypothetical protein
MAQEGPNLLQAGIGAYFPFEDQLPVQSDLQWLATVEGKYHVQRGRVKHSDWSTTSRNFGDRVNDAGIYGFRIVVELNRTSEVLHDD